MTELVDKLTSLTAELRSYARMTKGGHNLTNADAMKVEPLYQLATEVVGLAKQQERRLKRLQDQKDAMQRRAEAAEEDWQSTERQVKQLRRQLRRTAAQISRGEY
jgi:predicted  nucleic acid-binding Zn-ribbon protein